MLENEQWWIPDFWGMEKLFHSLWKEIAGRALCWLSVPSHREGEPRVWMGGFGGRWATKCCLILSYFSRQSGLGPWGSQLEDAVLVEETDQGRWWIHSCVFSVPWRGLTGTKCVLQPWWAPLCVSEISCCLIELWHCSNRQKASICVVAFGPFWCKPKNTQRFWFCPSLAGFQDRWKTVYFGKIGKECSRFCCSAILYCFYCIIHFLL